MWNVWYFKLMHNAQWMKHEKFLISEFWILSWGASVQRAMLYKETATEEGRATFRKSIIQFVEEELLPNYKSRISEEDHLSNIEFLSDYGTKLGQKILCNDGYKIGVAQKLLNLQLKYLWCFGIVAEPPHCPIDRVIINKTTLRNRVAWTKIVTIDEYKNVIAAVRKLAQEQELSISLWELKNFDRSDA